VMTGVTSRSMPDIELSKLAVIKVSRKGGSGEEWASCTTGHHSHA
jgi:hypothetical protein